MVAEADKEICKSNIDNVHKVFSEQKKDAAAEVLGPEMMRSSQDRHKVYNIPDGILEEW